MYGSCQKVRIKSFDSQKQILWHAQRSDGMDEWDEWRCKMWEKEREGEQQQHSCFSFNLKLSS